MATTLEYDLKVNSIGLQYGQEAAEDFAKKLQETKKITEKITDSSEQYSKSLERQEARIKVLDGAINLLGGSVELAAGAIVGLGLASEEDAKQFEAAALGAIAFADGAKRTLDGVKNLSEGLKAYGGIAKAAQTAQAALNKVISANPYVAAGIAIAAVGAAIYTLVSAQDREQESLEDLKQKRDDYNKSLQATEQYELQLLKLKGATTVEIAKMEEEIAKAAKDRADNAFVAAQLENRFSEETKKAREDAIAAERAYDLAIKNTENVIKQAKEAEAKAIKEANEKRKAEEEKASQERFDALNHENNRIQTELEDHLANIERLEKESNERRIENRIAIQQYYDDLDREAFEKELANLKKRKQEGDKAVATAEAQAMALTDARVTLLGNTAAAVGALSNLFEEGTAANKAAALAEIAIGTATGFINALDIAQKSSKATGPAAAFAFPIFYASQIAAVLGAVASAKQVLAKTPGGAGSAGTVSKPTATGGGGGTPALPSLGGGFQGLPAGSAPIGPAAGVEPIRAYVVSNDVSNGVQAQGQLRRRRRLGPG